MDASRGSPMMAQPSVQTTIWQRRAHQANIFHPWLKNVPHLLTSTTSDHTFSAEADKRGAPGWCGLHVAVWVCICVCTGLDVFVLGACVCVCVRGWLCGGQCNTLNQCGRCENRGSAAVEMNKEENCVCFVFTSCEIAINYVHCWAWWLLIELLIVSSQKY